MPLLSHSRLRGAALASALAVFSLLLAACEKPDASYVTSPSADSMVGTATGNVAIHPPEALPAPKESPPGWEVSLELAVFTELEDGTDSMRIVMQVKSRSGTGFEIWLANESGTVVRWSGGSSSPYNGVVCFQLPLSSKTKDKATGAITKEALTLPPGKYTATTVFRDVETGVVVARQLKVTGNVPRLAGPEPGPDSPVFRKLLGCPRGT